MNGCKCKDWEPNMFLLDGMIGIQALMSWGNKDGYTGKPFVYCPWCGEELQDSPTERSKGEEDASTEHCKRRGT